MMKQLMHKTNPYKELEGYCRSSRIDGPRNANWDSPIQWQHEKKYLLTYLYPVFSGLKKA